MLGLVPHYIIPKGRALGSFIFSIYTIIRPRPSQDGAIDCSHGNSITETRQRDTAEELIFDEDEADMREWQEEHPNEHRIRDDELPF